MPSQEHEAIADLVRERPDVVVPLLRGAGIDLPLPLLARRVDPTFAGYTPDYAADAVVALGAADATPDLVVVVEVQLARDDDKAFSWPVYEALARARHKARACVLVLALDDSVARWAERHVLLGPTGSRFMPLVIGPSRVPVVTTAEAARALPELAVLSAVAHANDPAGGLDVLSAAIEAIAGSSEDRGKLYLDLIYTAANKATRKALEAFMDVHNWEYESVFARRIFADGLAEGLLELAAGRGLEVSEAQRSTVKDCKDPARLRSWLKRAATATSMADVLAG
jgi:hypothetical protein